LEDTNLFNSAITGVGALSLNIVIPYPISIAFSGSGSFVPGITNLNDISTNFVGIGAMEITDIILRLKPLASSAIGGAGDLFLEFNPKVPIPEIHFSGIGEVNFLSNYIVQLITAPLTSHGNLEMDIDITAYLEFNTSGIGAFSLILVITTSLSSYIIGTGDLLLRRLGALNEEIFELDGINLAPGSDVTIDTDELSVFFGYLQDVSSVTSDSVFFDLFPGENSIIIETDVDTTMNVTAIWQNRWL